MSQTLGDLHKDASPQSQTSRAELVQRRFQQLNTTLIGATDGAWTYLMTINGGGAASILAFMAAVPAEAKQRWPFVALAIFTFGLFAVGLGRLALVLKFNELNENWIAKSNAYYAGQIGWRELDEDDDRRAARHRAVPWICGWISFASFIAGVVVIAIGMKIPPA